MKNLKKLALLLFTVLAIMSCEDDKNAANIEYLDGVINLHAESTNSGVNIKWENPTDLAYDKVEVSYTVAGEVRKESITINEKYSMVPITLPDAQVYKFTITPIANSTDRLVQQASVKGRKLVELDPTDELGDLINSIEMYGGDAGVRLIWLNPQNINATIQVKFNSTTLDISANRLVKEYTIPSLDIETVYTFNVQVLYEEVSTEIRTFMLKPALGFRRIVNDGWSITASSELTSANALAVNLIDGKRDTYWQSQDLPTGVPYLHYVIIDLKRVHKIQGLTLSRRYGSDEYSSWDNNISVSLDGTNYYATYNYFGTNTDPNKIFAVEFNRTVEGEQMYLLPYPHDARYIRIDMVRANKRFAVFGNIFIYGE